MKIIGLTGGISTGKSSVSAILSSQCDIIDADLIARQIVVKGSRAYVAIVKNFGKDILHLDGTINRKALGLIIFSDKSKRKLLESITHPRIIIQMAVQVVQSFIRLKSIVVMDIPLLFEGELSRWMSEIWVVSCPREIQIERLMRRDKIGEEEALMRIDSQLLLSEKCDRADFIIENSKSKKELLYRVDCLFYKRTPKGFMKYLIWIGGVIPASIAYVILFLLTKY